MTFQWPAAFVGALMAAGLLWLYVRVHKQRTVDLDRHPSLYVHATGIRARSLVQHLPLALILAGLVAATVALARPHYLTTRFTVNGTVLLAVDVSLSMRANDAEPNRLARSQALARAFATRYADELRIGLISIAGDVVEEIEPTTDREALFAAIERLAVRPGTDLGSGIKAALATILPDIDIEDSAKQFERTPAGSSMRDSASRPEPHANSPGSYSEAAVVLISDGQSASGPEPVAMARLAASLGVRIHTIGIGSAEGRALHIEGWRMRVQLDEAELKAIAKFTAGEYFSARGEIEWARIADAIKPVKPRVPAYTEVTALFAGLAALLAIAGALVSLARTKRVV